MRNYDEIRASQDMSFTLCGQVFTLGHCSAVQYAAWEKEEREAKVENGEGTAELVMRLTNHVVLDLLNAEDGKRWKAVMKRKDGPTLAELTDLRRWIIEVQTDLPTMPPASSEPGRARTAGSSKGA